MQVQIVPSIKPFSIQATINFSETDIDLVFVTNTSPDEDLFFKLFSPVLGSLAASQQLALLQKLAADIDMANNLNLSAGNPQSK